jgi:hypothetical protein
MEQPILVPLDKLPEGLTSSGQTTLNQRMVWCLVHDPLTN